MAYYIPRITLGRVYELWHIWNLRGAILLSLFLQILLSVLGPIRKSVSQALVIFLIWLAYVVASSTANFALVLISNSRPQENGELGCASKPLQISSHLLALWAPFLLLHLGGPDTITAFALEDNELWLRQFLGLCVQAGAILIFQIQSLPNENLRTPMVLMFIAGFIKSVERTRALYIASLDIFRESLIRDPDPGPNYAKFMEEYAFKREAGLPTRIILTRPVAVPDKETKVSDVLPMEGELNDLEVLHYAYKYFNTFKGLVVNLIFSFRVCEDSREFFINRYAEDALRIVEVELNFLYGTLYTKMDVAHSLVGCCFRFLAFGSVLATLVLFHFRVSKQGEFHGLDIRITYILLLGAIAVDVIAFLMLISSDRIIAFLSYRIIDFLKNPQRPCRWLSSAFSNFLALRKPKWQQCQCKTTDPGRHVKQHVLTTSFLFRRWSGSISTHNLISYCLLSRRKTIHEFPSSSLGSIISKVTKHPWSVYAIQSLRSFYRRQRNNCPLSGRYLYSKNLVDGLLYVSSEPFTMELWEYIFAELKGKSELANSPEIARWISSARGDWILTQTIDSDQQDRLLKYVTNVPYDQSLLLWHIATDLCYYDDKDFCLDLAHRDFSKILSDYMLYLLIFQPTMMSAVAGIGEIRYRDTCAEAEIFFQRRCVGPKEDGQACEHILSVNTDVEPECVKGNTCKSVLFDASMLAKELKKLETQVKWKVISSVWVELLSYAASNCRASAHAEPISKGGELVTFVWLLMAHFGLGERFQIDEACPTAKLLVRG